MNYSDLLSDFAKRTLSNLNLVKRAADAGKPEAFEVTQLWNSLLGLIVAPRERDLDRLPDTKITELDIAIPGKPTDDTLRGVVKALRNAVAHFNVEFQANGGGEIDKVWLWNAQTRGGPHTWDAHLDIDQLEQLGRKIAATYIKNRSTRDA